MNQERIQRERAQDGQRTATAREFDAYALESLVTDPELSVFLSTYAVRVFTDKHVPVVPAAEDTLHRSLQESRIRLTLRGHKEFVDCVAFSPDGRRLATGSWDNTAKVWDAASGHELLILRGHQGRVSSVTFSPNGQKLATGSDDGTAKLWDVASGHELLNLKRPYGASQERCVFA